MALNRSLFSLTTSTLVRIPASWAAAKTAAARVPEMVFLVVAGGAALAALGVSISAAASMFGVLASVLSVVLCPLGVVLAAVAALGAEKELRQEKAAEEGQKSAPGKGKKENKK